MRKTSGELTDGFESLRVRETRLHGATFVVGTPAFRDITQQQLPSLARHLSRRGFDVQRISVAHREFERDRRFPSVAPKQFVDVRAVCRMREQFGDRSSGDEVGRQFERHLRRRVGQEHASIAVQHQNSVGRKTNRVGEIALLSHQLIEDASETRQAQCQQPPCSRHRNHVLREPVDGRTCELGIA